MRFLLGLAPFLGLPLLLACGARSGLPDGAGGHPASTTTATTSAVTTTGATSSSGTGSPPPLVCHLLQPVLTVDDPGLGDIVQPNLVDLSTSPPTAALVFASRPAQGPTSLAQVLGFDGWGAWPPPLTASGSIALMGNDALGILVVAATRHEDSSSSAFSLLSATENGELSFTPLVNSNAAVIPVILGGSVTPLAIASNGPPTNHMVMTTLPDGPYIALSADRGEATKQVSTLGDSGVTGCATTPITADAAGTESGFIVGAALGTELQWSYEGSTPCAQKFKEIGPATHLRFTTVPWGMDVPPVMSFEPGGTVDRLRMMPRSDGAWAVWSVVGGSDLDILRVSAAPALVAGPSVLIDADVLTGSFDIERLGDALVIGQIVEKGSTAPQIRVRGWDSVGPTWTVDIPLDGAVTGPIELLTPEAADVILVAWSELAPSAEFHRMRIARLDCSP